MKKKVLILANHSLGIYNFRKELIQELLKKDYEVILSLPQGEKIGEMVEWGCKYVEADIDRRGVNPVKDVKLFFSYLKLLRKIKPSIVLAYTAKPNIYGGLACRFLGVPYVNNITGLGSGFNKGALLRSILENLYKIGLKKSSCVFFQNESNEKYLTSKNIVHGKYRLIPGSGVNIHYYKFKELAEEKELRFIFVGRIMKDKGIDEYLEAAGIIKRKYSNVEFELVGFVEESQSHYNEIITKLEDEGVIKYHGFQSEVQKYMGNAHCLVQPSYGEGLSNVLLEAAALGRILIASDIPGCREVIDENKNGYTFEVRDTSDLVEQIEKVINLTWSQRKLFGKNSRKKVEKTFNRKIVVDEYMQVVNEVTEKSISDISLR